MFDSENYYRHFTITATKYLRKCFVQQLNPKKSTLLILFLLFTVYAKTQCYNSYVKYLGDQCGYTIVDESWQGGDNIRTTINDCEYINESDTWRFEVIIEFYGQFSGSYYRTDGIIFYSEEKDTFNYYPSYKNQNLRDYELLIDMFVTGAVIYQLSK